MSFSSKQCPYSFLGLFFLSLIQIPTLALGQEEPKPTKKLLCTAEYLRVDNTGAWGLAGDSNGVLEPELVWNEDDQIYKGNASYRFKMDQSSDDSNSPYGIRGDFTYSEGNGLGAVFNVSKFSKGRGREIAKTIANFAASSTDDKPRIQNVGILGQELNELRLSRPGKNLSELIKGGKLKQDDLISVNINFCSLR
jgi:hypothetical protein